MLQFTNFTVSAVSAFRRNVSAETKFVPVHFGRSRNQAETVCYVSFGAVTETETEFRSVSKLKATDDQCKSPPAPPLSAVSSE